MNSIFEDSEQSFAFTQIMTSIRSGDKNSLMEKNKRTGLLCAVSGGIFAALFLILLAASIAINQYTGAILCGVAAAGFLWLTVYGIKRKNHPEKSRILSQYYPDLVKVLNRNTGYPAKPYSAEEWEIPIREYSTNELQSLLGKGNGLGENNVCFIALQIHDFKRSEIYAGQFIVNLCDKGIVLMPIEYQAENKPVALTALTTLIPNDEIKAIKMKKENDAYRISVQLTDSKWLYAAGYYSSQLELSVMEDVPDAPFHQETLEKLKETI